MQSSLRTTSLYRVKGQNPNQCYWLPQNSWQAAEKIPTVFPVAVLRTTSPCRFILVHESIFVYLKPSDGKICIEIWQRKAGPATLIRRFGAVVILDTPFDMRILSGGSIWRPQHWRTRSAACLLERRLPPRPAAHRRVMTIVEFQYPHPKGCYATHETAFLFVCVLFGTIAVADEAAPLWATNEYYFVGHQAHSDGDG